VGKLPLFSVPGYFLAVKLLFEGRFCEKKKLSAINCTKTTLDCEEKDNSFEEHEVKSVSITCFCGVPSKDAYFALQKYVCFSA